MMVFGLAPAIAPVLGGWLQVSFGWRSVFWFLSAFGILMCWPCTARCRKAWRSKTAIPSTWA
jgi:DHA1 family bicyclomycin/chloramphenicol resistance-like MFS transporter